MPISKGIEVRDKKNDRWGVGKVFDIGDKIKVRYPGKPGIKIVDYEYPDCFRSDLALATPDEEIQATIDSDLEFSGATRESIALKYSYCDGGKDGKIIGCNGICSEECLRFNTDNRQGNTWCRSKSLCSKYRDGEITRDALEKAYANGDFVCYESTFMKDWMAKAGRTVEDNRPEHFNSDVRNGLAIMTTTKDGMDEKDRFVFAVFLIDSQERGDDKTESSITASMDYRITLSDEESREIKFWNYYYNPNSPMNTNWSQGLHRYISHGQAARLLQDIIEVKQDESERAKVKGLLDKFCRIHGIKVIPPRDGALTRA